MCLCVLSVLNVSLCIECTECVSVLSVLNVSLCIEDKVHLRLK